MTHQTGPDDVAARNAAAPPQRAADVGARIECVESTPDGSNARAPLSAFRDVSSPLFIGIDPGLTGAIALVGRGLRDVEDLPVCANGQGGSMATHIDAVRLAALLREWSRRHEFAMRFMRAVLERPIANATRPGGRAAPAVTIAQQFETYGAIRGVLAALLIPTHFVTPQKWKKGYGLKGGKDAKTEARRCCERLYPSAPVTRVKDHNRAEAILLAHYGEGELS
jgi:crossover junction endodeoxyribonuclease RuvC